MSISVGVNSLAITYFPFSAFLVDPLIMEESNTCESVPDLKDLELKVGRKTPEGLLKWMREDHKMTSHHQTDNNETEKKGLDEKIRKLKMEMVRSTCLFPNKLVLVI